VYLAEHLKTISMFGLLENGKLYSKAAYRLSNRILKLTSAFTTIFASQHDFGFAPTSELKIQI
jgi:hypothetical protein